LYLLAFSVTGVTAGTLTPKLGTNVGTAIGTTGSYQQILTADAVSPDLIFTPTSTFDGALTSISLKALSDVVNVAYDGTIIGNGNGDENTVPVYGNSKVMVYFGVLPTASAPVNKFDGAFYFDSTDSVFKIWDSTAAAWVNIVFV
jgi:hypothetical protein